jgi:hypothetical protein
MLNAFFCQPIPPIMKCRESESDASTRDPDHWNSPLADEMVETAFAETREFGDLSKRQQPDRRMLNHDFGYLWAYFPYRVHLACRVIAVQRCAERPLVEMVVGFARPSVRSVLRAVLI